MKLVSMWPFRHAGLKVVSLALAVALWMAVSGEEVVERGLRVPLELQQFPPGLELSGEPFTLVDVRVRGGSGTLGQVTSGDVVAMLDLRAARPGRRLFQLTPENVRVPFGVEVVQVTPSSIAMVFEKSATRQIRIAPRDRRQSGARVRRRRRDDRSEDDRGDRARERGGASDRGGDRGGLGCRRPGTRRRSP